MRHSLGGCCWPRTPRILKCQVSSFIHSFIHSLVYFCHKPEIQQQYTEIYNTLKIIYNILTKLFTRSYVESGNGKEAYVEAGDF